MLTFKAPGICIFSNIITNVVVGFFFSFPSLLLKAYLPKLQKMIPNGYLIFEDETFLDSTVAKMNALRKSGQFCDVRLQVKKRRQKNLFHKM